MRELHKFNNQNSKTEPIFKSIFGQGWESLPPIMKKHYANRPYCNDITEVEGVLDVSCRGVIKWLSPLFWLLKGIPPCNEKNIPVTVRFESCKDSNAFIFNRIFHFKNRKAYHFKSQMVQIKDNEVIEIMSFGLGWRMNYCWEDNQVKLKHKGYILYLFGYFIPLPLTIFIGAANACEIPIDNENFKIQVSITHGWRGKIYQYKGKFKVTKTP